MLANSLLAMNYEFRMPLELLFVDIINIFYFLFMITFSVALGFCFAGQKGKGKLGKNEKNLLPYHRLISIYFFILFFIYNYIV
jgi:hypothetical protein